MNRNQIQLCILALALTGLAVGATAQTPLNTPIPGQLSAAIQDETEPQAEPGRLTRRTIVRMGGNVFVSADETVEEVVVLTGTATIEGRVERNVVVVLGMARLGSTAVVDGDLVVMGGSALVMPGATVNRSLVVVGGTLDSAPEFTAGREQVIIGPVAFGERAQSVLPWISRGLLWGRLIVPELPWVWSVIGIFFALYLAINAVFDGPVRACVQTLAQKPLSTFLTGLVVLSLAGPVSFILAVSVVGLAVVPFLWVTLLIGVIFGRVAVSRWIGSKVVREQPPASKLQAARSLTIGFTMIAAIYMAPILGLAAWAIFGVFALGAASMAFATALGRENPAISTAPAGPKSPPLEPEPTVASSPAAGSSSAGTAAPAAPAVDLASFPPATFLSRLAAFGLDVILVAITYGLLGAGNGGRFFLLLLAYHIGFWTWKAATVGGIICRLRVTRTDGTPVRFTDALVRGLSGIFSFAILGIGFLWILQDPNRQAWHDKIAGTYVITVPRNTPLP